VYKFRKLTFLTVLLVPHWRDNKRSRLDKNFWFSTGQIVHAIQAAPAHKPTQASVSLTKGLRHNPPLENLRNFYHADPLSHFGLLYGATLNSFRSKTRQ
jgi:hypothetical protein